MGRYRQKKTLIRSSTSKFRLRSYLLILFIRRKLRSNRSKHFLFLAMYFHLLGRRDQFNARPPPFIRPNCVGLDRIIQTSGGFMALWNRIRFTYQDIFSLARHFLPERLQLGGHHGSVGRVDALATLLLHLSDPAFLNTLTACTGYADYDISLITRATAKYLGDHWFNCVADPRWLSEERLTYYNDLIRSKGCPIHTIVGFIDGTRRPICRPRVGQETFYNGWLHNHNMLFIAIAFPDGTFILRGPIGGRWNDLNALRITGLSDDLPRLFGDYAIGGDGIFPFNHNIHPITIVLDGMEENYSASRVSVEWLFGDITNIFRFFRFKDAHKIGQTIPAMIYRAGAILSMARTCLYGCQISQYFRAKPPDISVVFPPTARI